MNKKFFVLVFFISNLNSSYNNISQEKIKLLEIVHDINNMLAVAFGILSIMENNEEISILRESLSAIQGMIIDFNCFLTQQKIEKCLFSVIEMLEVSIKLACSHRSLVEYSIINNASHYYLKGNPTAIIRAFYNLFHNSCEAMKNKGKIEIYVKNIREDNHKESPLFLEIKIKDNGPGIDIKEDIEKIFEPFISSKGRGRGLGLHIVKNIIENLEGTIFVEKENESSSHGTTFIIRLPIEKSDEYKKNLT